MSTWGNETRPKARKEHRCQWCYEPIPVGEVHYRFVGDYEGEFQDWRMHTECERAFRGSGADAFLPGENERPERPAPTPEELLTERRRDLEAAGQLRLEPVR